MVGGALRIIVLCVALLIAAVVIWCMFAYPTYTYRYRMTVEIVADGALHTGTSVIEVETRNQPMLLDAPPQVSRARGQAVFIDLGNRGAAVALLASGPRAADIDYPTRVVPAAFKVSNSRDDISGLLASHASRELSAHEFPAFAVFRNINDYSTGSVVTADEFGQAFNGAVRLSKVRISLTDEPVSSGLRSSFPWWDEASPWKIEPSGRFGWDKLAFIREF